jgi:hypothetical protein
VRWSVRTDQSYPRRTKEKPHQHVNVGGASAFDSVMTDIISRTYGIPNFFLPRHRQASSGSDPKCVLSISSLFVPVLLSKNVLAVIRLFSLCRKGLEKQSCRCGREWAAGG